VGGGCALIGLASDSTQNDFRIETGSDKVNLPTLFKYGEWKLASPDGNPIKQLTMCVDCEIVGMARTRGTRTVPQSLNRLITQSITQSINQSLNTFNLQTKTTLSIKTTIIY